MDDSWKYIDDDGLPNARPIAFSDSPRCQRSHGSVNPAPTANRLITIAVSKMRFINVNLSERGTIGG